MTIHETALLISAMASLLQAVAELIAVLRDPPR